MQKPLPPSAIAALQEGGVVDAIRVVREVENLDLRAAKERVDAALTASPSLRALARPGPLQALGDYLAESWKTPLVMGLCGSALVLWGVGEFFPDLTRQVDVGILLTVGMAVPMISLAAVWWVWARRWKQRREATLISVIAERPVRPRFAGMPDPGSSTAVESVSGSASIESTARAGHGNGKLSPEALAALDRDDPITAIKVTRAATGLGLAEAKTLVDAELRQRRTGGIT